MRSTPAVCTGPGVCKLRCVATTWARRGGAEALGTALAGAAQTRTDGSPAPGAKSPGELHCEAREVRAAGRGTSRFEVTRRKGQTSTVKNSPSEVSAVTKATSTDCLALRGFLFTVRLRPHHPLARCTPPLPGPPCQGLCSPKSEGTAT